MSLYNSYLFPNILLTFFHFIFTHVLLLICLLLLNIFINFALCKQHVDKYTIYYKSFIKVVNNYFKNTIKIVISQKSILLQKSFQLY